MATRVTLRSFKHTHTHTHTHTPTHTNTHPQNKKTKKQKNRKVCNNYLYTYIKKKVYRTVHDLCLLTTVNFLSWSLLWLPQFCRPMTKGSMGNVSAKCVVWLQSPLLWNKTLDYLCLQEGTNFWFKNLLPIFCTQLV